jgi:hypothetical protein
MSGRSAGLARRSRSSSELSAAGLGALPWIEDRLKARPHEELAALARRLSNIVREATLDTGRWDAPKDLREKMAGLKGKALVPGNGIDLVVQSMAALPTQTGDIELHADRIGGGTGTTLTLRVTPKAGRNGTSVESRLSVEADGRSIHGSYGSGVRSAYATSDRYEDTRKAIERALGTPHSGTFEIRISLEIR